MAVQPETSERKGEPTRSLSSQEVERIAELLVDWPHEVSREWAWGGSEGEGVRVCILDSGVESGHPLVGPVDGAVAVSVGSDGEVAVHEDLEGDLSGHGTACAGIIRSLAPRCKIVSVRVLGADIGGTGKVLLAGLSWAVEQGFEVINMSLSTTKREFVEAFHDLADSAYFRRSLLTVSAHNMRVDSYPWRFSSVVSVGSHEGSDPQEFFYNPTPPVEFFARGVDVEVAWSDGARIRSTGHSFAAPHISGICALILGKHPRLTPFQLKSVLYLTATNAGGG